MYTRFLELCSVKQIHRFDPEGMKKVALNYYFKELQSLFDEFKKSHPYQITSSEGYFDYAYFGKLLELTEASLAFLKKVGIENYNQFRITNSDGAHEISVLVDRKINWQRHIRSYCKIRGYKIKAKNNKEGILLIDIIPAEPTYDFENDPQFRDLPLSGISDILALFPEHTLSNREEKEKAILFSIVGAQEKSSTRGGVGASILSINSKRLGAEKLISKIAKNWYPSCTRNMFSSTLPSFIGGHDSDIITALSGDPTSFLKYKINRDIVQLIPKIQRDPKVLGILSYVHAYVYLDEEMEWVEPSNVLDMLLFRARLKNVKTSSAIIEDARAREERLNEKFYEEFNRYYRLPEAILDIAECIAKIEGKTTVSTNDLQEAEKIIYNLRHEAADEIGEQARLFEPEYRGKTGIVRIIYNLIGIYGETHSRDEIKHKAIEKGITKNNFDIIVQQFIDRGEIYIAPKDGTIFVKLTSPDFHIR